MSELTVKIDRNPEAPKKPDMLKAREENQRLRELAEERQRFDVPAIDGPAEMPEPEEDLESVEVQLPNGLVVEFGPPSDVSLTMRIIRVLGDSASSPVASAVYRILFSIRTVNGTAVTPITNSIEAEKLANKIGDGGIDILSMVMNTYWKPLRMNQLPVLKKNQRKS
jgi:hypothetical protein